MEAAPTPRRGETARPAFDRGVEQDPSDAAYLFYEAWVTLG